MALSDFLFGAGALKKAAKGPTPAPAPAPVPQSSQGIDVAAEAQKAADRMRAQQSQAGKKNPSGPLATPMGSTGASKGK